MVGYLRRTRGGSSSSSACSSSVAYRRLEELVGGCLDERRSNGRASSVQWVHFRLETHPSIASTSYYTQINVSELFIETKRYTE